MCVVVCCSNCFCISCSCFYLPQLLVFTIVLLLLWNKVLRYERMADDAKRPFVENLQRSRRPRPSVAPKTIPWSRNIGGSSTLTVSGTAERHSTSLDNLSRPSMTAVQRPLTSTSVARQLIRDLQRRQLQLRQRGILSVDEILDTAGVQQ